jgi:predicted cupin superfamily sugar epimerase
MTNYSDLPPVERLIEYLDLTPLDVEGGHFRRMYSSSDTLPQRCLPLRYSSDKLMGSAILYLLTSDPDSFSAIHKLVSDEIYHFYLGDSVELWLFKPDESSDTIILGQDVLAGQHVQYIVPHGTWQGARLVPGGNYALLGTTMAPGYDDSDFTLGDRTNLIAQYPSREEIITSLTRKL